MTRDRQRPVIRGSAYCLAHVPDLVRFGSKPRREIVADPQLLPRLVPTRVSEEDFWRNYFSHVFAVKSKYEAHQAGAPPVGGASAWSPSSDPDSS